MSDHNSKKWESDTDRESTPNKLPSRPRREDRQLSDNDQEESASSPENPFIYDEDEAIVGSVKNHEPEDSCPVVPNKKRLRLSERVEKVSVKGGRRRQSRMSGRRLRSAMPETSPPLTPQSRRTKESAMEISMRSQKLLTSLNRQLHEDLEKARSEAEKSQFLCEVQAERIKEVKEEGILLRKQVESLLCVKNVDEAVRRGKEYYQGLKDSLEHHHGYLIELIAKSKATLAENENFLKALDELETIGNDVVTPDTP